MFGGSKPTKSPLWRRNCLEVLYLLPRRRWLVCRDTLLVCQ